MLTRAEQQAAIGAIAAAAYDPLEWPLALRLIAKAGQGWSAQLIGVSRRGVQFHVAHGIVPEMLDEFDRRGGTNPAINPRARILSQSVYTLCRDRDLAAPDELRGSEFVNDFLYRDGGHDILAVNLPVIDLTISCLVVSRNRSQFDHDISEDQYLMLLRSVHDAMRLAAAIDNRGTELVRNALSGLRLTAFIVNGSGLVAGLTPAAEALARDGDLLRLSHGTIRAADHRCDAPLQTALSRACVRPNSSSHSSATTLTLRSLSGALEQVEVAPLPDANVSLRFGPVAILVVKAKARPPEAQIVQGRFNLSNAEMRIVEGLLAGKSLADIAGERAVSLGTVRSQVKSIFAKTDVRRQSQLVALLHQEMLRETPKK